jgi:hypothetical protein
MRFPLDAINQNRAKPPAVERRLNSPTIAGVADSWDVERFHRRRRPVE